MMKYQQVNYLMDVIMPRCKNSNAFKVVSIVARETWGRKDVEWVDLSYADLLEKTGIKTVNTLKVAIADADPFVEQQPKDNQGFTYRMKTMSNIDIVEAETVSDSTLSNLDTVSEIDTELYQDLIEPVSEFDIATSGTSSKENKEGKEEKSITPPTPPEDEIRLEMPELPFKPKYSRLIPPALQDNQFLGIWATYEEFRASSAKPMTEFVAKRQLAKMAGWGVEKAIAAMNHTMDNGYSGLIEPSQNGSSGDKKKVDQQFTVGAIKERLAKKREENANAVA